MTDRSSNLMNIINNESCTAFNTVFNTVSMSKLLKTNTINNISRPNFSFQFVKVNWSSILKTGCILIIKLMFAMIKLHAIYLQNGHKSPFLFS